MDRGEYSQNAEQNPQEFEVYADRVNGNFFMTNGDDYEMYSSTSAISDNETVPTSDMDEPLKIKRIQRVSCGYVINSNVYLTENQWHTLILDENINQIYCVLCDEYIDVDTSILHLEDEVHEVNIQSHVPIKRFELSITRKIRTKYHCAVCNEIFDDERHVDTKGHGDNVLFAINKATDLVYDYNLENSYNEPGIDVATNDTTRTVNDKAQMSVENNGKPADYDDYVNTASNHFEDDIFWDNNDVDTQVYEVSYAAMASKAKAKELPTNYRINLGDKDFIVTFDSWHMITYYRSNEFYCMVCQIFDHRRNRGEHCRSDSHMQKLKLCVVINAFDTHLIRKVDDKLYHCGHCNNLQPTSEMENHLVQFHPTTSKLFKKMRDIKIKQTTVIYDEPTEDDQFVENIGQVKDNLQANHFAKSNDQDFNNKKFIEEFKENINTDNITYANNEGELQNIIVENKNTDQTNAFYNVFVDKGRGKVETKPLNSGANLLYKRNAKFLKEHVKQYYSKGETVKDQTIDIPAVTDDIPAVTDDKPAVTDDKPAVTDDKPAVTDAKPAVTDDKENPKETKSYSKAAATTPTKEPNTSNKRKQSKPVQIKNPFIYTPDIEDVNRAFIPDLPQIEPNNTNSIDDKTMITFIQSGHKLSISLLSFNTILKPCELYCCLTCDLMVEEKFLLAHVLDTNHVKLMQYVPFEPEYKYNLIRKIKKYLHCGICNLILPLDKTFLLNHNASSEHSNLLRRALGFTSENPLNTSTSQNNRPNVKNVTDNVTNNPLNVPKKNGKKGAANSDKIETKVIISDKNNILSEDDESVEDNVEMLFTDYILTKLKNIFIKVYTYSWHTLVERGDGSSYCFLCATHVDFNNGIKHIKTKKHLKNIDKRNVLGVYGTNMIRQIENQFHCANCNVIIDKRNLQLHLEWPKHLWNTQSSNSDNKHALEMTGFQEEELITHKEKKNVKDISKYEVIIDVVIAKTYKSHPDDNIISDDDDDVDGDTVTKMINGKYYRIDFDNWHGLVAFKSGFSCKLCAVNVGRDDVTGHVQKPKHSELSATPFLEKYPDAFIRQLSETRLHCVTCNVELSTTENIEQHTLGKKHRKHRDKTISDT